MDTIIDTNTIELAVQQQQCINNNMNNSIIDEDSLVNYFLSEDISMISSGDSPIHNDNFLSQHTLSNPSSPSVVPNSSPFNSNMDSSSMTSPEQCYMVDTNNTYEAYSQFQNEPTIPEFPVQIDETFNILTSTPNVMVKEEINTYQPSYDNSQFIASSPIQDLSSPSFSEESLNSSSSSSGERETSSPLTTNKQKKRSNEARVQNLVHPLTREELLKLSGKEPVRIEETPTSCLADERQVKKQRRLIKNRESAQLSRMRKKIYIEDLEKKIGDLTSENTSLRDEVLYLQGLIKQFASTNPEISNQLQQHESIRQKNAKAAGVCLLIIIFSIGIFLNPQQQTNQPSFTNSLTPTNARRALQSNNNNEPLYLTLEEDEVVPDDKATMFITPPQSPPSESSLVLATKKRNLESSLPTTTTSTPEQQQKKRIRIIPEDESSLVEDPPTRLLDSPPRVVPASPRILSGDMESDFNLVASSGHLAQEGPIHSSYIVCSDQPRIISNNLTQTTESILNSNPSSPLTIGLLLPSESIGNLSGISNLPQENSILEISCQVSNIRVWNPQQSNIHTQQHSHSSLQNNLIIPSS